jgi:DeoR/GlpR family transcriptional regulator of sugar metabolism
MNQRQSEILNHLSQHGQATVQELAGLAGVSMVTMRQDLSALENEGLLKRTHGGASLLESESIAQRLSIRFEQKQRIAEKAASLVTDGETVLLESGSANALLARQLAGRRVQLLVTNLFIARQVKHGDLAKVVVLGGIYQPDSESVVGALARQNIRSTFFTKAFLGMDGFTPETGFTNRDMERAEIAALVVERCESSYILADSSKFGSTGMAHICNADELAGVITNKDLPEKYAKAIKKGKAALHLA